MRREVFFFDSEGTRLYGSLFVAAEISRPHGVVACQSWGVDADRSDPLLRSVALAMAKLGGAGFVFHYPGFGDSFGDLADVAIDTLAAAAADALGEVSCRLPSLDWTLAGFMFGASVASLAQHRTGARRLLLVQPELRPGAYLQGMAEASEPLAPGPSPRQMREPGGVDGMVYGYPLPRRILDRAGAADDEVAAAIATFEGEGAVIRHLRPEDPARSLPERFERIEVGGAWRFGSQNHPGLAAASADWLDRAAR